jgi:hypothetical protein
MKELDIYIPSENVSEATEILHKHEVGRKHYGKP